VAAIAVVAAIAGVLFWLRRPVAAPASPPKPNVLLITLDTTRADHLGSYGDVSAATPNLDRLAAGGVRFEQALSSVPLTLPSHASLMTGRQPFSHGVRNNGYFSLAADVPTLAQSFAASGYDTAAFVSSFVLDRQFGLARGFSTYDDTLDHEPSGGDVSLELERRGDRTVAAAAAWLAAHAVRPFFLWVHLYDPHEPYAAPSPFREQFAGRPYDGEIAFVDSLAGVLIGKAAGSPALIVVAGDHGESLGDHGESTHGLFVYESALHVPLIIAGAGIAKPAVVKQPVRLVDVAPTVAELAGLATPAGVDGQSLRPLMTGAAAGDNPAPVYAETYFPQFFMGWSPLRSIRVGRWKYIEAPEPELYDLSTDAGERSNVLDREASTGASLRRALESMAAAGAGKMSPMPLSDQARQRLASLGYVSAVATAHEAGGGADRARPDPKKMVAVFERLLEGNRSLASGRPAAAAQIAREVMARDAGNAFARLLLGRAALALGQNRDAMAALKGYLELVPQSADAHHWTALAALRLGDRARALAEEEAALALDPRHGSALALRAGLLFTSGRADEGIASLRTAIREDPANDALALELADLLSDAHRFAEAEPEYRRVLEKRPRDARALTGFGTLLAVTDRLEPALEQLTRALEVDDRNEEARFARADVYARLGRAAESRADYQRLARSAARPDLREAARRALAGAQ
jgi:arylsulfatase A-like enzyme/Flp pilus assembly protein TadD